MSRAVYPRSFGWAFAFAGLALLLGSLFVYPRQWTRGFMINDEAWYAEPARNIAKGRGYVTETLYPMFARDVTVLPMGEPFKQIGYPLVAALVGRVFGTFNDRLFIAIAIVGLSLTGMTTWLVSDAIVRNRALAGAITLATIGNPSFWSYWTAGLPESLFTALFLGAIYLLVGETAVGAAGAGALLVASVYVKGFPVLYVPLCLVFTLTGIRTARLRLAGSFVAGLVVAVAAASLVMPAATRQLSGTSSSAYAGSMLLFETRGAYPAVEGPFYDIAPIRPIPYILGHPLDYAEKVARMMSRTKGVMEELGGPAFGGVLFLLLVFLTVAVAGDGWQRLRGAWAGPGEDLDRDQWQLRVRWLLAALLAVNFAFFWAGNFRARYFAHLFPLMLASVCLEGARLMPRAREWARAVPKPVLAVLAGYFLIYPPAVGLWTAYRDRDAYLGRMQPVRWVDYQQVAANVDAHVPANGMVMSDMAHEISWYTGHPTVFFPGVEDQVDYLLDKFDVQAIYQHPKAGRRWQVLRDRFVLIDDRNGELWVRRDDAH